MGALANPSAPPEPDAAWMEREGFRPLGMDAKALYERSAAELPCALPSSIQFPSLHAYNQTAVCRHQLLEDLLCILVQARNLGTCLALPPMGRWEPARFERVVARLHALFQNQGLPLVFCDVPLGLLDRFTNLEHFDAQIRHDPAISDYVFSREAFARGLEKPSARQALRHLERHEAPDRDPIGPHNKQLLVELTRRFFCAYHRCDECSYGCELEVVSRFVGEFEALGLRGVIARSAQGPLGYIVAYRERDSLFAFSKRVRHGVRGLNEWLNAQLLRLFDGRFEWINYSEDMGHEGMRFYKQRLGAFHLQHRFQLTVTPTIPPRKEP